MIFCPSANRAVSDNLFFIKTVSVHPPSKSRELPSNRKKGLDKTGIYYILFLHIETHETTMTRVNNIVEVLTEITDKKTMTRLFGEIFTPAEIQDVALRWRLMKMLHEGTPQREIAQRLGISLCKITRGSKILKSQKSVSKKILNRKKGVKNASRKKTGAFT